MSKQKIISIAILALIAIFSFLGWWNLNNSLFGGSPNYETFWIIPLLIFVAVMAFFGLLLLLFNKLILPMLGFLIVAVIFILFFGVNLIYLAGLALGLGFIILAARQAIREKNIRIKIAAGQVLKQPLKTIFVVLSLVISLVLFFAPAIQRLSIEIKLPRPMFDMVFNTISGVLSGQNQNQTAVNVSNLMGVDLNELKQSGTLGQGVQTISKEEQDKLYNNINQQINSSLGPYKQYLPYLIGFVVFFTLATMAFVFVWLATGLVNIFFSIMKKAGWIDLKKEMVEKETILI